MSEIYDELKRRGRHLNKVERHRILRFLYQNNPSKLKEIQEATGISSDQLKSHIKYLRENDFVGKRMRRYGLKTNGKILAEKDLFIEKLVNFSEGLGALDGHLISQAAYIAKREHDLDFPNDFYRRGKQGPLSKKILRVMPEVRNPKYPVRMDEGSRAYGIGEKLSELSEEEIKEKAMELYREENS